MSSNNTLLYWTSIFYDFLFRELNGFITYDQSLVRHKINIKGKGLCIKYNIQHAYLYALKTACNKTARMQCLNSKYTNQYTNELPWDEDKHNFILWNS